MLQDDNATGTGMMALLPLLRCSHYSGDAERSRNLPAAPATGDASLLAGIEVTNPDMTKQAKTQKQKSRPVDAGELSSNHSPSFHILRWVKKEVP
jgi:hypothetical protein